MSKFFVGMFATLGLIFVMGRFLPEAQNTWPSVITFAAGCAFIGVVIGEFYGKDKK